jgi:hypothetical protein
MTRCKTVVCGKVARLWQCDGGAILATEWVVVATILILGIIPALVAVRQGVLSELVESANAFMALNQSYSFTGVETVCGNSDLGTNDHDDRDGANNQDGQGGLSDGTRTSNFAPSTADASIRGEGDNLHGSSNGFGRLAFTAGSAAQDQCSTLNTRSTPPVPCQTEQSPCD